MADVHPRPAPARTGPLAASRPARLIVMVASVLALVALLAPAPASARPAQDPAATTTSPVDGAATTLPGTTTGSPTTTAVGDTDQADRTGSHRVADENRKIWAVVGALVLVAIALSLLTIRYWRRTRPVAPATGPVLPTDAALALALASTPDAPVDEASVDDIVDTSRDTPDTSGDTAPVPVVEAPPVAEAPPRRAVAGADHAAADAAWEPRGTGEHQRVVVATNARPHRLSAEQRAALFARRERGEG